MFTHNLDPFFIQFTENFGIRWYSLAYLLGFTILYFLLKKPFVNKYIKNWKKEYADSYIVYTFIGMLLGARIMHVLMEIISGTSAGSLYLSQPWQILYVWHGGLAFHGALIGIILATYYFCKKYKIKFYDMADFVVIPIALFLVFGRIANFINAEMVGTVTSVPWCVNFPAYEGCRHPTVLYEAIYSFLIFVILYYIRKIKELQRGTLFWSFITLYGLFRFFLMYLREETIVLFGLTLSQIFCAIMFIVGSYYLAKRINK